jgi:hypothetical protein
MQEISSKDIIYFWNLGLTVVIFKNGQEVMRGDKKKSPSIENMILAGDGNYSFFIPFENKNRFLKYLIGQFCIGIFCGYIFSIISLMFIVILFFLKDIRSALALSPVLLFTLSAAIGNLYISNNAYKRMRRVLMKLKSKSLDDI